MQSNSKAANQSRQMSHAHFCWSSIFVKKKISSALDKQESSYCNAPAFLNARLISWKFKLLLKSFENPCWLPENHQACETSYVGQKLKLEKKSSSRLSQWAHRTEVSVSPVIERVVLLYMYSDTPATAAARNVSLLNLTSERAGRVHRPERGRIEKNCATGCEECLAVRNFVHERLSVHVRAHTIWFGQALATHSLHSIFPFVCDFDASRKFRSTEVIAVLICWKTLSYKTAVRNFRSQFIYCSITNHVLLLKCKEPLESRWLAVFL